MGDALSTQDRGGHVRAALRGLVNLNVHFHLLVPDGMFAQTGAELAFMLLPRHRRRPAGNPRSRNASGARRLAREERDDTVLADSPPELLAQLQTEAATTWRSCATSAPSPAVISIGSAACGASSPGLIPNERNTIKIEGGWFGSTSCPASGRISDLATLSDIRTNFGQGIGAREAVTEGVAEVGHSSLRRIVRRFFWIDTPP